MTAERLLKRVLEARTENRRKLWTRSMERVTGNRGRTLNKLIKMTKNRVEETTDD